MADANPLAHSDIAYIAQIYTAGSKYREIAAAVDRPMGTIKTTIHRMIRDGAVERRNERALDV